MGLKVNNHTITECCKISISFKSPEGLNKFTEFMFKNNISPLGFELSRKNTEYIGVFSNEDSDLIKEYLKNLKNENAV